MLYVSGIGHVTDDKISAEFKKQSWEYAGIKKLHRCLKDNGIIQNSLKDFGRLDVVSKKTVAAVGLALYDASLFSVNDDIGIIGSSNTGSLSSNMEFFKDYVDSGRKMARGNLFVYTLPSAALAAAAIAFGFKGPLFFEMYSCSSFYQLIESATKTISDQDCKGMVAISEFENKVSAYLIEEIDEKLPKTTTMTVDELLSSNMERKDK